jgi:hypothetical protein
VHQKGAEVTEEQKNAAVITDTKGAGPPGTKLSDGGWRYKHVKRRRLTISVHPDTDRRLTDLCMKYGLARGVIVDRTIDALSRSIASGVRYCAHGPRCVHNLTDLPEVL